MRLWPLVLILLTGCPFAVPTPIARVRHGPAHGGLITPLAAMPVLCDADADMCAQGHANAVANATRMEMEYAGYNLVDSELINAEMRRRFTTTQESTMTHEPTGTRSTAESTRTELSGGVLWSQLSSEEQRSLLAAIGVRGLLHAGIRIGPARGMASQRTVTVAVTVTRLEDNQLAWHSRCAVETGDYHSTEQAIDLATWCALQSEALW